MSFLAGSSEMAERIRSFPWHDHPFGPPEDWPQSLRSALGICLNSAFPTAIYWGSELRLLYNDAWSAIPGPRHPACLGQPAQKVWADIWHVIEPQFTKLIETGQGIFVEDQPLPMRRFGFEEETYWTYNFTPIRGEDGSIEGVFNSGFETTEKVLKRRQTEFLLQLSDSLRHVADPDDTLATVCAMLGDHLQAVRVCIREFESRSLGARSPMNAEWTAEDVDPLGNRLPMHQMGDVAAALRAGKVVRIDETDMLEDPHLRVQFNEVGAGAVLAVPWMSQSGLTAVLAVHHVRPHRWTDEEVATVEQVFERTISAVERERSLGREKAMMAEIDHRARNLLSVVRAIVRLNDGDDVPGYKTKLLQRLTALANTHSVLADGKWVAVSLKSLFDAELQPYRSDTVQRIWLEGADVTLEPVTAQAVSMAIHELGTNAAKHGALSTADGDLNVSWSVDGGSVLKIRWAERSDHLAASQEEARSGFGYVLLRELVERQLNGSLSRRFSSGRFECVLDIPIGQATGAGRDTKNGDAEFGGVPRLMVVEDDPLIAMDLEDQLASLGFSVVATAHTLRAALSALETRRPDAAIIDVNLGFETAEPLAALLRSHRIPFLRLSGYGADPEPGSAFFGVPRLLKPFSEEDLLIELERVLQDR